MSHCYTKAMQEKKVLF